MPLLGNAGAAYCRAAAKASGSSFYYALWLLPPARREAMFAVYSVCRAVDDVVDSGGPTARAEQELDRWRRELTCCYDGRPAHPITTALMPAVRRYGIPRPLFDDLLTGMAWDLVPRRYATFADLEQYCYRVAGSVGLIAIRVFGCRRPDSDEVARRLGTAFQLTNILRDLAEDAARGRLYLPQEDLARFGVQAAELRGLPPATGPAGRPQGTVPEPVRALMAFEIARARTLFAQARAAITPPDRWALTPALAMAGVYEGLLDRLAAVRAAGLARPIRLARPRTLWLALRGAVGLTTGPGFESGTEGKISIL